MEERLLLLWQKGVNSGKMSKSRFCQNKIGIIITVIDILASVIVIIVCSLSLSFSLVSLSTSSTSSTSTSSPSPPGLWRWPLQTQRSCWTSIHKKEELPSVRMQVPILFYFQGDNDLIWDLALNIMLMIVDNWYFQTWWSGTRQPAGHSEKRSSSQSEIEIEEIEWDTNRRNRRTTWDVNCNWS